MSEILKIFCSVREIEKYFNVRLHETCAREAFDLGGEFHGSDYPNMLLIIQGHKYLVTGFWGLVPAETGIENISTYQNSNPLIATLYTSLTSLYSRSSNSDLKRCIVPITSIKNNSDEQMDIATENALMGLAGVYRRIGNITVFSLLHTNYRKNKKAPIKMDANDSELWLDYDYPIGHNLDCSKYQNP